MRTWYWAIEANRGGPDYFLTLNFAPQNGALLSLVSQHHLADFERASAEASWLRARRQDCPDLEAWTSLPTLTWTGNLILVCGSTLHYERHCGGSASHDAAEQELLLALSSSSLPLTLWSVIGGGQGYASHTYAAGTSWAEFAAYRNTDSPLPEATVTEGAA